MNCLEKVMNMGIEINNNKYIKTEDFEDACKLIKNYNPESLLEIFDTWENDNSNFYKEVLAASASNLLDNRNSNMDTILNELLTLPFDTNNNVDSMCLEIKKEWNLSEQLSEEIEELAYQNKDLDDYYVKYDGIDLDILHLKLLSIESIAFLINIFSYCNLQSCDVNDICRCIDKNIFLYNLTDESIEYITSAIDVLKKKFKGVYKNLNEIIKLLENHVIYYKLQNKVKSDEIDF